LLVVARRSTAHVHLRTLSRAYVSVHEFHGVDALPGPDTKRRAASGWTTRPYAPVMPRPIDWNAGYRQIAMLYWLGIKNWDIKAAVSQSFYIYTSSSCLRLGNAVFNKTVFAMDQDYCDFQQKILIRLIINAFIVQY